MKKKYKDYNFHRIDNVIKKVIKDEFSNIGNEIDYINTSIKEGIFYPIIILDYNDYSTTISGVTTEDVSLPRQLFCIHLFCFKYINVYKDIFRKKRKVWPNIYLKIVVERIIAGKRDALRKIFFFNLYYPLDRVEESFREFIRNFIINFKYEKFY